MLWLLLILSAECPTWVGRPDPYPMGSVVVWQGGAYTPARPMDNGWIEPSQSWFWVSSSCPVTDSVSPPEDSPPTPLEVSSWLILGTALGSAAMLGFHSTGSKFRK